MEPKEKAMMSSAERLTDVAAEGRTGRLVIRRTDMPGENKLALMLADDVDRSAPAGPVFGAGIEIEVLEIVIPEDGPPIVHLGVVAGAQVRIEREERLTATRLPQTAAAQTDPTDEGDEAPETMDLDRLEEWISRRRSELTERDAVVRNLREELRKARARGYAHRNNDGHVRFEILQNEQRVLNEQRGRLKERLSRATAQLKELRRRRSEERLSGFHAAFYRAARAALPAEQLTTLENEAAAAVGR
ncbi:MAG: hypothetical protein IPJ97_18470 [Proteobacteria bacterium]|nr:hypothetical protein [Pseudomonadota bacterium]